MTKAIKRMVSIFTITVICSLFSLGTFAAMPTISSNEPISFYAAEKQYAYTDETMETQDKKHYIAAGDFCSILAYNSSYNSVLVQYPTAKGTSEHWFSATVCTKFALDQGETKTSNGKFKVYRTVAGNISLGSVYSGDVCYVLGASNNRAQIIYPVDSGGYKMGHADIGDVGKFLGWNTSSSSPSFSGTEDGVKYTYQTVTLDCSSLEAWMSSLQDAESQLDGIIVEHEVLSTKTITVQYGTGPSYKGNNGAVTQSIPLAYKVKFKLHKHDYNMGFGRNWVYRNGSIVCMQTCDCGFYNETLVWEIPLPDPSEYAGKQIIRWLPQNNH